MPLYQTFQNDKKLSESQILDMFKEAFEGNREKMPIFFQDCLEHPNKFQDYIFNFFKVVTDNLNDYNTPLYKGANLMTLLFCATFHLGKLYVKSEGTIEDAAKYYNSALAELLTLSEENQSKIKRFNMKQQITGFLNSYQYALLMQHISMSICQQPRDYYNKSLMHRYISVIEEQLPTSFYAYKDDDYNVKLAEHKEFSKYYAEFDIETDILQIILKSNNQIYDMYDKDIKNGIILEEHDLYCISVYANIWERLIEFKPLSKTFIIHGEKEHDDEDEEDEEDEEDGYLTKYGLRLQKELRNYIVRKQYINLDNIKTLLCFNEFVFNVFFEYDSESYEMKKNTLYNKIQSLIWELLENSEDLSNDCMFILHIFLYKFGGNFANVSYQNETILYPILRNKHFQKNASFIRYFLNFLIIKELKPFKGLKSSIGKDYNQFTLLSLLLDYIDTSNNDNILTILLKKLYPHVHVPEALQKSLSLKTSIAFGSKMSSEINYAVDKTLSLDNTNIEELRKYFRTTVKNLIKYYAKEYYKRRNEGEVKGVLLKLKSYKDALKESKIDMKNLYRVIQIVDSAQPLDAQSVFNKYESIRSPPENDQNMFINFIDKKLMNKMEEIYIRTVQSNDDTENNFDRIIKVRNWFIDKHLESNALIKLHNIENGKELEALYNYWLQNQQTLLRNFEISYAGEVGIDVGGLTKQFFTAISDQILDKYFMPIEESDRHVLKYEGGNFSMTTDEARFLGQLMASFIVNGMTLEYNLSYMYLAYMMFEKKHITDEERFMYYLLDIDNNKKNAHIEGCSNEYLVDDLCNLAELMSDNIERLYHLKDPVFNAFMSGYNIKKKYFYSKFSNIDDKIRIYDMDKLLTTTKLTKAYLKRSIFDKIKFHGSHRELPRIYGYLKDIMLSTKKEYEEMYKKFNTDIVKGDDNMHKLYKALVSDQEYKKNVLMFWTASRGVCRNPPYQGNIMTHKDFPISHTCFNQLELPHSIESKQDLFDKFMNIFVLNQHKAFGIA